MEPRTIVVVEDEEDIAELIRYNLEQAGFAVRTAADGERGLDLARREMPAALLLDLMLPGIDGLEVCRRLRRSADTAKIPIVMVTARGEEADIVAGLELGADDYVTKPFRPRELIARVRAVIRRQTEPAPGEQVLLVVNGLTIHPGRHEVRHGERRVELTASEFKILHLLARRRGWVLTRQQIVDGIRGPGYPVTDRAVDVHITSLRKKLGDSAELIETVRGVGYRFKE